MEEIETLVVEGVSKGERASSLAEKILSKNKDKNFKGRFLKAETRAKLIARDQVLKLQGAINKSRQEKVGVSKYIWRTARDERVRDEHKLEGALFNWSSKSGKFIEGSHKGKKATKPKEGLNPSEDINCRCYAEPYFEDIADEN